MSEKEAVGLLFLGIALVWFGYTGAVSRIIDVVERYRQESKR